VDVTNPVKPYTVGIYDPGAYVYDPSAEFGDATYSIKTHGVDVSEGTMYVMEYISSYAKRLRIVDVSDPHNPQKLSLVELPDTLGEITVSNGYAYTGDRKNNGIHVIDVRDSQNPHEVEFFEIGGKAGRIVISGDYAYIAAFSVWPSNKTFQIWDISDPGNAREVGYCDTFVSAWDIDVSSGNAYLAAMQDGLRIIDVSDLRNPYEVGHYNRSEYVNSIAVSGNYVYALGSWEGFRVLNVDDPLNPYEVGSCNVDYISNVVVSSGYAYVAGCDRGFYVFDVSDPQNPHEVADGKQLYCFSGMLISENLAYIMGGYPRGVRILDISDPHNPYQVGFCEISSSSYSPGDTQNLAISGNYVYIANGGDGLCVINVSDPKSPYKMGCYESFEPGSSARGVVISGDYAYVADDFGALLNVFDISDPGTPRIIASCNTSLRQGEGIAVSNGYVYVAGFGGFVVVDVSDPHNPYEMDFYNVPGRVTHIVVVNNLIYTANGNGGMSILRFTGAPEYPSHFDWRDNNGDWITPVKDQGLAPTCYTFAAVGVLEAAIRIAVGDPELPVDLSEQCISSFISDREAFDFLTNVGICSEGDLPYQTTTEISCDSCDECRSNIVRIEDYFYRSMTYAGMQTVNLLKSYLVGGPVFVRMMPTTSFYTYEDGIYDAGDEPYDGTAGGHSMLLVGWDDAEEVWICKNSWGTGWGEDGFCHIKWESLVGI